MLKVSLTYGFKNFQNHMGINTNVTLRGLLKRSARRYPRTYNLIRKGSLLCGIYFVMMSLIPGSSLPLQKPIKLSLLSFSRLNAQLWYYNALSPEPQLYLIKLNQILLSGLDHQIYDPGFIGEYFAAVRVLVEEERKQLKQSAYLDLLLYSQVVLQNFVRFEKRLLLEQCVLEYYAWVCATVFERVNTVSAKEIKHVRLAYSVLQYLINFSPQQKQQQFISNYHRLVTGKIKGERQNSFAWNIMEIGLEKTQFISALKQAYTNTENEEIRAKILEIFESLNSVYLENSSKK